MASVYPVDSIKNVAESIGLLNLREDVARALALDLEYRLNDIIETAAKFMRHGKRNRLTVEDLNHALKLKNLEPLFGYRSSTRPINFKKTTSNWQELYYIEDEEIDFDRVIHTPLPKVPLETTFTAHWLAIEGVQPAIPQNPSRSAQELTVNGTGPQKQKDPPPLYRKRAVNESTTTAPLQQGIKVETTLSHELQLFYDKVTQSAISPDERVRSAALASLRIDPGLEKLLAYLIQFFAGGIVELLKAGEALGQMIENYLSGLDSLLSNETIMIEPYLHHILPSILSVLVTSLLMDAERDLYLRRLGASLLGKLISLFSGSTAPPSLRPRVCRTLLRALLETANQGHYDRSIEHPRIGAIQGIEAMGCQIVRTTLLPHLKFLSDLWQSSEDKDALGEAIISAIGKIVREDRRSLETSSLYSLSETELVERLSPSLCVDLCQSLQEAFGKLGLTAALDKM